MSGAKKPDNRILVGRLGAAHGISGEIRLSSFTEEPMAIASYGPLLTDQAGLVVTIEKARPAKTVLIARLAGVKDRTGAEKLNGVSLYIDRAQLAETEDDEFYHADLIGLKALDRDGAVLGVVTGVVNFGADDLLDLRLEAGGSAYLPFTRAIVPEVSLAQGHLVVVPPEGWLDDTPRDPQDKDT
ncbi:ribosome maturation factor RimM [Pelagibacterium montanilacus]|uniref:ribosome maturation factor RimM n=1 Tax=Pelagibacterium montanilacus TaxID=2185280 RepID=UPI000F8CFD98|nr:ribosome maturation factor RimM [Pelagibacterium montanilacus]